MTKPYFNERKIIKRNQTNLNQYYPICFDLEKEKYAEKEHNLPYRLTDQCYSIEYFRKRNVSGKYYHKRTNHHTQNFCNPIDYTH